MPAAVTVGGLVINVSADTGQLKTEMAEGSRVVDAGAKSMINSLTGVTESSDRVTDAGARMIKQLKDEIATFGMTTQELARQKAGIAGVGAEYDALTQRLNAMRSAQASFSTDVASTSTALRTHGAAASEAGGHVEEFGFKTASSKRELLVLAHELSQGNYKKFGGSMLVLAEQTGAAGALFSVTGLAALAFGATLVGVSAALIKGAEEQRAMNNALIETGNYAGTTSDSLNALAHAAVTSGGSLSEAKKAVTDLAGTGKFTSEQIGYITDAAVGMEHAAGKSIEKTIAEFESLAVEASGNSMRTSEAISKAAVKLDEQYHFLTEAVYEQIRALEKEGDQKGASALATQTLAKVTKERAEEMMANIGGIQHAWQTVKEVIGGAIDNIENMGKRATPGSEVAKYRAQLVEFDKEVAESNARLGRPQTSMGDGLAAARLKIVMNLTGAVDALNKVDAASIEQGKKRAAQSEGVLAASRIEQDNMRLGKKSVSELDDALQKYAQDRAKIAAANPASPLLDPEEVKNHIALITKAHTEKPRAAAGQDDRAATLQDALTNEQAALDREKSIYDARDKMLDLYHTKFGLSDGDFYAGRAAARQEHLNAEAATFGNEKALLDASAARARNPQEVAAAKGKYDQLVKAHDKFVDDMRNAGGADDVNADAAAKKQYDDLIKSITTAGDASLASLDSQIEKQKEHNAEIGKTKEQIELARQAQVDAGTAKLQLNAADLRDEMASGDLDDQGLARAKLKLHYLDDEIAKRATLSSLTADGADAEAGAKAAADLDKYLDPTKAQAFGNALKGSFGGASDSLSKLTKALQTYGAEQEKNEKARAEADIALKNGSLTQQQYIEKTDQLNARSTQNQLAGYGDMASAAAGFFGEHSRGYQTLTAVSHVFHAAELAMTMAELVPKAISAVLTQGSGDPYTAFGRMAAMGALVAGLGVAIGGIGGGSDTTAKDRQAAQGTGTVLGDSSAKSDSISKGIELTAANSSTQINYLSGLLTTLKGIETDIKSFAGELIKTTDLSGDSITGSKGSAAAFGASTIGVALTGGIIGLALDKLTNGFIGKITGSVLGSIFGGKQTVTDTGFTLGKTSLGSALANGVDGKSYADITTSGGWFSSDKKSEQDTPLGADANQQFSTIIKSLASSITQASGLLGVSGDDFTKQLNSFVIDIGNVSLKGLSADDQEKAIEAVFSKLGDQMAQAAIPDLTTFQQVGEGYLETLVRVASDYAKVDASLQSVGMTFGSVGVASIAARENLIALAGGIDTFQSETADFATNFLTKAQQLAPVKTYVDQAMAALGYSGVTTREQFASIVQGLDLSSAAVEQTYATLMGLESAFAAVTPAIVDATKSAQDIADERKDLQDQLDTLTMTQVQLNEKARDAIADNNKGLYDQVQAAQAAKDAIETHNSLLDLESQIYALTGDKAGAAAVLEEQHAIALAALDPALRGATQNLWDLQAASTAASTAKSDAAALLSNVDAAYSTLDTVIGREKDALQKRIDVENDVLTQLTSLGSSIKSALSSYDVASDPVADRKAAQATLANSLALMQSGTMLSDAQVTALQDALATATKDSKGQFGSYEDYMFDMLKTQREIAQLGDVTNDQETTAQKQLDEMKAQSTALDDQLAAAKQQVDLLKGIDTSTTTLAQAMSSFQLSLSTAQANPLNSATPAITQAYQDALGRAPDAAGLSYWQGQVAAGASTADVVSSIKNSKEASIDKLYESLLGRPADPAGLAFYMGTGESLAEIAGDLKGSAEYKAKIPGFALGGDHAGGWRIVGEDGPELEATGPARIFNAQQTSSMLNRMSGAASSDNTALFTAAFSKMQETMEKLRAETRATAIHSAKTAGLLKRVIRNDSLIVSGAVSVAPATA